MTQIGLMIEGQNGLNWEHWKRLLRVAEDSGFHGYYYHAGSRPCYATLDSGGSA